MRTILSGILCLFLSITTAFSQDVNPEIKSVLDRFTTLSNEENWDKAFDLLYPKLFSKVPKQDLVTMMETNAKDGLGLRMENIQVNSTSVPVEEGQEQFVRINYEGDVIVAIKQGSMFDTPKTRDVLEEQFKIQYGSNVKWDEKSKSFKFRTVKNMIAVQNTVTGGGWKLVEINPEQTDLMKELFSASIYDSLIHVE